MKANLLFSLLLEHLENCGGCLGHRKSWECKYARACSSAEVLHQKGIVQNSKDLLLYGTTDNRKPNYLPEGYSSNSSYSSDGPCTSEPSHEPVERVERRIMRVTAYTSRDRGMNGLGITANGEKAVEGRTIAADKSIPFGAEIYIPKLGKMYTVTDRGNAIRGDKLDLYMESRKEAMEFGVQYLEVYIKK